MKISKILEQKAIIDSWECGKELLAINEKVSAMKGQLEMLDVRELQGDMDLVSNGIRDMMHDISMLQMHIENSKDKAKNLMDQLASLPLGESYDMYDERKNWFNTEKLAEIRTYDQFAEFTEYKNRFETLISKYAGWRHPSVYIRPNSTHFFNALKASDILYVMEQDDVTEWLKENTSEKFYDKSIRFKLFNENKDTFIQHMYPAEQIGLIVMENFINFKPLEIIKQYLIESLAILKPGGHLLFTYNNCDLPSGARNFEEGLYCFTPGKMLKLMCETSGFEVIDETISDRISWFALKKPGELTSLKGGKCLGQIKSD